jgi:hypothetical protein
VHNREGEVQELYIVGLADEPNDCWHFIGVFDAEQKAVDACTTKDHFVGPAILNERLPDAPEPWPGGYYPLDIGE